MAFRPAILCLAPTKAQWRRILRRCRRCRGGHDTPCWIWTGHCDKDGYGEVKHLGEKRYTHRVAYAYRNGATPAFKDGEHLCRQRCCCNPDHLTLLSRRRNAANRSAAGSAPVQINRFNVEQHALKPRRFVVPF